MLWGTVLQMLDDIDCIVFVTVGDDERGCESGRILSNLLASSRVDTVATVLSALKNEVVDLASFPVSLLFF